MPEKRQVSAAVSRPTRTAIQATPAVVLTDVVDVFLHNLTDREYGVIVALLTILIGWAQNLVENRLGKGLLRRVPPTTDPVPGA